MTTSPFPGMDPYLEAKWPEVHASLIVYARNCVNPQLPEDLQANIEENLVVRSEDNPRRGIRPDVNIKEDVGRSNPSTTAVMEQVAIASSPVIITRAPYVERHIEIVAGDGRIITTIEFVSPRNKIGARARSQYSTKQTELMHAGVNLVEIDLTREGGYVLAPELSHIPRQHRKPYLVSVYRDIRDGQFELYPTILQEPLPTISIPLRSTDKDVLLPLQRLIDSCYIDGRYHRIDYRHPPLPPLDYDEEAWADTRLRSLGLRD